jgi:hypothetical protein
MLKLISKASPRTCAKAVNLIATVAEKLGADVVEDKDVNRYWIKTKRRQYIIASRFLKRREPEIVYGNSKKGYHAGYISFWRGYNKEAANV